MRHQQALALQADGPVAPQSGVVLVAVSPRRAHPREAAVVLEPQRGGLQQQRVRLEEEEVLAHHSGEKLLGDLQTAGVGGGRAGERRRVGFP